ncbi:response regulator [Pseudomonas sp. MRSN 12121]|uniref:response regulator n=1 Tax=Pseudomonas sp. MRSN 12121 TaxID=1611770 RepID=UPI0005BEB3C1|nr:response regulator [Pseudomonas sp. MRSN 12121]AJO78665.1 hypothetical protein TO66_15690 [Pseudomonas sp. MRSN 12121]
MPINQSKVGRLARVSLRLHFSLILSLLLCVFFVVAGYWVTYKVFRGERIKANYHFLSFVGRAYDHEIFLLRAINASVAPEYNPLVQLAKPELSKSVDGESLIYTGQASQYSTTFSIVMPRAREGLVPLTDPLALGIGLANVYSDFWSGSSFLAPQMFLLDPDHHIDIALPSIDSEPSRESIVQGDVVPVLQRIKRTIERQPPKNYDLLVHWAPAERYSEAGEEQLLAYISVPRAAAGQGAERLPGELVAATLVDLREPDEIGIRIDQEMFDSLTFDAIDLMAPDGTFVLGSAQGGIFTYENGFHLTSSGLVIKRSAGPVGAWQALYRISFLRLVEHARWQLMSLAGLLAACVLSGWGIASWYRRRIVLPARSHYSELRSNHDFNHSLLQTVPLALCVLKGPEQVTCNGLFNDWLGQEPPIATLLSDWPMFEGERPLTGEGCLMLGERAFHVRYAPTVYQNEEVLLCTFTDVTEHRAAAATLVLGRQVADAASAEKSRFVATVSHEIRTPLYGVLGTLELLGLTDLTPQQRTYLQTIDHSSDLLLHVINDVLDMSKIESGQLQIQTMDFNPLHMLEELARGFCERAANKGLALYTCIDPQVPAQLSGDSHRLRQVIGNLLSNAIKFTDKGYVAIHLTLAAQQADSVQLLWRVIDSGPGIEEAARQRLFEPFYQVDNKRHSITGAGLGLPICASLCELMGATLQVHSTVGQGSEFSVGLSLARARDQGTPWRVSGLAGCKVAVHSPFPDLTDSLCAWLEHFGARTSILEDLALEQPDAVLEVMPEAGANLEWGRPTVFARHDFALLESIGKDVLVNQHSLAAIMRGVSLAVTGELPEAEQAPANRRQELGLDVLLVEDNPVNQALMREQLEHIGCRATLAGNGREALLQMERQAFDLILTDVNMPLMDGYELTAAVRRNDQRIPIIGVTANALREEGEHCIRVGMNSWLSKPISIDGLYLCLKAVAAPARGVLAAVVEPSGAPAIDLLQVPPPMLALFTLTLRQDLDELKAATRYYDASEVTRLLHRIRSSLSVGKARSLIRLSKELEVQAESRDRDAMSLAVERFIDRVEVALAMLDTAPQGPRP